MPAPQIYQLFVRTFSNANATRTFDGDLATNGCGKFEDINDAALASLHELGATHLWLTGVLRQATLTDYAHLDPALAADPPEVVKGRAGSPYAIRDYFDVCPDYARDPAKRLEEFEALVARIHKREMKVLIDLVPNHVARTYASAVKPELDFGRDDDRSRFFAPNNNYFYLVEPADEPLQLSYPADAPARARLTGTFERERPPRATANNQATHRPRASDWYEAVKLNYGFNFVDRTAQYEPIPDTWHKLDAIVSHWQSRGVDGFRCDFAHWVPVPFWRWLIRRAKARRECGFMAEAYDSSPEDTVPGFSQAVMIEAGFDALYDYKTYNLIKEIVAADKWANDLDAHLARSLSSQSLVRYLENHDERRAASPVVRGDPGNSGFGSAQLGFAATALVQLLGPGAALLYNGQEVGEPARDVAGFGGAGRTSIFDYTSMPELAKWVNHRRYDGAQLSREQRALRERYAKLWTIRRDSPFVDGEFQSLQSINKSNDEFGERGHWVYAFARVSDSSRAIVLVNLNGERGFEFNLALGGLSSGRARDVFTGDPFETHEGLRIALEPGGVRVLMG